MAFYLNQLPLEHLWWLLWQFICAWEGGVGCIVEMPATFVLTHAEMATTLFLSLTGLCLWLWLLVRFVYWLLVGRRRRPKLEDLIVEFTQAQEQAQRDYLLKLLER